MNGGPIQRVVTHGTFELDGGSWEVDNNIWVVGDDSEVVVFDAAHDSGPIVMAVGGRHVVDDRQRRSRLADRHDPRQRETEDERPRHLPRHLEGVPEAIADRRENAHARRIAGAARAGARSSRLRSAAAAAGGGAV